MQEALEADTKRIISTVQMYSGVSGLTGGRFFFVAKSVFHALDPLNDI